MKSVLKNTNSIHKVYTDKQLEKLHHIVLADVEKYEEVSWIDIASAWGKSIGKAVHPDNLRKFYARHVTRISEAIEEALTPHPHQDFTREALGDIVKETSYKGEKHFFISAIQAATSVHELGLQSVLRWVEENKGELVLLPMRTHTKPLQGQPAHYDPLLKDLRKKIVTDLTINKNLRVLELQINPQQVDPLAGTYRVKGASREESIHNIVTKRTSLIIAHSKQNMKLLPIDNKGGARMLHSTGSLTLPNYLPNTRTGLLAQDDHVIGGLVVTVLGDKFWVSQVQISKDGSFTSRGRRYFPNKSSQPERAEAFVMGDLHPDHLDNTALEAWFKSWKTLLPKRVFLHDFFGGSSVSHHYEGKQLEKVSRVFPSTSLKDELEYTKETLDRIHSAVPQGCEVIAVASNHSEHLTRYLTEGRYIKDSRSNYEIAHRMVVSFLDGENFLKKYIDPSDKMTWLNTEEDYWVEGVQCGAHGHLGANGGPASLKALEQIYSSSASGHSHTPGVMHGAYAAGHTSLARHGYNKGPSSWAHASVAVYKGGHKELIFCIEGKVAL